MKIRCTNCGKRFDGEENLYICPKCNHYHSQVGKRISPDENDNNSIKEKLDKVNVMDMIDEFVSEDSAEEETEFIQTLNGQQKVYTAQKKTEEEQSDFLNGNSVLKKLGLAVCIIIGFVMAISSTVGEFDEWSEEPDSWGSDSDYTYTDAYQVDFGDPMDFETFTVYVESVGEPEFADIKKNEGCKLVKVYFTTDSSYEYEDETILTEACLAYTYESDVTHFEKYALYEDELTNDSDFAKQLAEDGLVTEVHYSGSYFLIFEIPEEADDLMLIIKSYVSEEGDAESYIEDESFQMPIEL